MPHSTRDNLIRMYEQTQNDLDRALTNIQKMTELYGKIKPEHTKYLEMIAGSIIITQDSLKIFRYRDM